MRNTVMKQVKGLPVTARNGANAFYKTAMNHPKTSAAVVLGTGAAAAILWFAKRTGGFAALHQEVLARVKGLPDKVRSLRSEQLPQ